jgi:hypothetical protein
MTAIPLKYVPSILTSKDKKLQKKMLLQSRRAYRKGKYVSRKQIPSYPHRTSKHILTAKRIYHLPNILPTRKLSNATGCSIDALKQIVRKGEGAYYSSGSRPSQTAQSWGIARLASALTGGKSATIDYSIIEKGCRHTGKAFKLAQKSLKKHRRHTRKIVI